MTEIEFIETVDGRFPYDDAILARELIDLGVAISPNAAFMVLHEICRPPRSCAVSGGRLNELLAEWTVVFCHPLVEEVLPAATAMIKNREISAKDAIHLIKSISGYANQFNALSIAYFACDDIAGEVESEYQAVIGAWATVDGLED